MSRLACWHRVKGALRIQPDFSSVLSNLQQFFHHLSLDPPGGVAPALPQLAEPKLAQPVQLEFNAPRTAAAMKQSTGPARGKLLNKDPSVRIVYSTLCSFGKSCEIVASSDERSVMGLPLAP